MLCAVGLTLAGSLENFYFLDEIGSVQDGMTLNRALNFFFKSGVGWGGRETERVLRYICAMVYIWRSEDNLSIGPCFSPCLRQVASCLWLLHNRLPGPGASRNSPVSTSHLTIGRSTGVTHICC